MEIKQTKTDKLLQVDILGRLDTNTSCELSDIIHDLITDTEKITLNLADLEYISSAGLRVLLCLHKECLNKNIDLSVVNCNEITTDIFRVTGFDQVLNIVE